MTEQEWLAATDPTPMIDFLRGKASERKLRLLVVASCRRIWCFLPLPSRNFSEALESYADGQTTDAEYSTALDAARAEARAANQWAPTVLTYATASVGISNPPTVASVTSSLDTAATAFGCASADDFPEEEYDVQCDTARESIRSEQSRLVLDIFGNPFRPIVAAPAWLASTVLALATGIYEDRAFDRLPILANALQYAGCDNTDILDHCRSEGPHVRGCWVVDLILGKS